MNYAHMRKPSLVLCLIIPLLFEKAAATGNHFTTSFAPIIQKTQSAVVSIYSDNQEMFLENNGFKNDQALRSLLESEGQNKGEDNEKAVGSGVIIGADGLVVTNHHVVLGSEEVTIITDEDTQYKGRVILRDEPSDLALIKILSDKRDFKIIEVSDSDQVQIGDVVLAMGNPFGLGKTVTSGIISALARENLQQNSSSSNFYIQTDAAINPGNSGGPLLNAEGQMIGINSAIYTKNGGSMGIGFAIPSNVLSTLLNSLHKDRNGNIKVVRFWLGGEFQRLSGLLGGRTLDGQKRSGIMATNICQGRYFNSPLSKVGIHPGDIITAVDNHPIKNQNEFEYLVSKHQMNSYVQMTLMRKDGNTEMRQLLLEQPAEEPKKNPKAFDFGPSGKITVVNLSPLVISDLSLPCLSSGAVVQVVENNNSLNKNGEFQFKVGDIITHVTKAFNGDPQETLVESTDQLEHELSSFQRDKDRGLTSFSLSVVRKGSETLSLDIMLKAPARDY